MDTRQPLRAAHLIWLPVDKIAANPLNPRYDIVDEDLDALGESLKGDGQIQPLIVEPILDQDGHYRVIVGDRRLLAARMQGVKDVEVKVIEPETDLVRLRLMFADNKQRRDLTYYEQLQLTERWASALREQGLPVTYESIAGEMGASRQKVSLIRRLAEFPLAFQEMVRDREVSNAVARAILKAGPDVESQALSLASIAMGHKLQGGILKDLIERVKAGDTAEAAWEAMQPKACACGATLPYGEPAGASCGACLAKAEEEAGTLDAERLQATLIADSEANRRALAEAEAAGQISADDAATIRQEQGPELLSQDAFSAMLHGTPTPGSFGIGPTPGSFGLSPTASHIEPSATFADDVPPWDTSDGTTTVSTSPGHYGQSVAESATHTSAPAVHRSDVDDPQARKERQLARQLAEQRKQLEQPLPAAFDFRSASMFLDALLALQHQLEPVLNFGQENKNLEDLLTYLKATATFEQIEELSRLGSRLKALGTNLLYQTHAAGTFVARKQRFGFGDEGGSNIVDFPARQTG